MKRREFIAGTAGAVLGAPLLMRTPPAETKTPPRSRVVLVRHERAVAETGGVDGAVLAGMLDDAVVAVTGQRGAGEAWRSLVGAADTVGIKTNAWRFLRTPPELEEAIRARVIGAGVDPSRVAVDDRGVLASPVFRSATALVNVRPLRTHHWAGVGSLIKNYIMFVEEPSKWHGDSCSDLAGLWSLPIVKGKTRLNVLVMLTPLFQSKGPHDFNARYTWRYNGLLAGTDPVAVDATGLRILEAKRRAFFGEDRPFEVPPRHIEMAETKFGLGVADRARIDLVRIGWAEGALI